MNKYRHRSGFIGFEFGGRGRTRLLVSIKRWDFDILYKMDRFLGFLALTKSIDF